MRAIALVTLALAACTHAPRHHAAPPPDPAPRQHAPAPVHDARGLATIDGDAIRAAHVDAAVRYVAAVEAAERRRAVAVSNRVTASPGILARIADCESIYGQYTYRDHGHSTSTASGKFGFLDSTWRSYRGPEGAQYARAFHAPEWVQDLAAVRLFNDLGTRPWLASKGCWG